MKKIIIPLIILIFLSLTSCSRYTNLGGGGCGAWAPKQFERDKKAKRWVRDAHIRNGWNRHY